MSYLDRLRDHFPENCPTEDHKADRRGCVGFVSTRGGQKQTQTPSPSRTPIPKISLLMYLTKLTEGSARSPIPPPPDVTDPEIMPS